MSDLANELRAQIDQERAATALEPASPATVVVVEPPPPIRPHEVHRWCPGPWEAGTLCAHGIHGPHAR